MMRRWHKLYDKELVASATKLATKQAYMQKVSVEFSMNIV